VVSFPRGAIRGALNVPGDKSISHRALIFQAWAREPVAIENLNPGRDVRATQQALQSLRQYFGFARSARDAQDYKALAEIDCANSGSTARMLLGVCAGANAHARFDGDESLRRRPMEPAAAQLRAFGARIETTKGCLPVEIYGRDEIQTRRFILLSPSAQVKSALLFAALFGGASIDITGDNGSRDHTERLLRYQGAQVEWDGSRLEFSTLPTKALPICVPGDFSAAAFLITAATVSPGSDITIAGVGVNPTRTGLLDALRTMGAKVELRERRELSGEPVADIVARYAPLRATTIDADLALRSIDEIPLLAIAAAFADGETRIIGIEDLRTKESDRIAAIQRLLQAVGIVTRRIPGGIAIVGGRPQSDGSVVETHDDHRIAMGTAVLAAAAGPIRVDEAASADVSFPDFGKVWRAAIHPAPQAQH
jgi:3-phosphoshikimate 1-carboxyvinyltransferase